jgi:hypothetical protein
MNLSGYAFKFEPAVWIAVIRGGLHFANLAGWFNISPDLQASLLVFIELVSTAVQRSVVTPNAKLQPSTVEQAKEVPPGPRP